jgi:Winged helix-turn-helix DNA-binding
MDRPDEGPGRRRREKAPGRILRIRIIAACNQREVTPREIAEQEGVSLGTANYHFRALLKSGHLRIHRSDRVGGFKRNWYVAVRQKVVTDKEFDAMKPAERAEATQAFYRDFLEVSKDAIEHGTVDARSDSHLSWSPLALDRQGWRDIMGILNAALDQSFQVQAEAAVRLRRSGEEPIPTIFALVGFEGPALSAAKAPVS